MPAAVRDPLARFDRRYFDRWYRNPRHRVSTAASAARKLNLVLGVAEYLLGRPVRSLLDVGCGEGQWQPLLRKARPRASYTGVDASAYAVARFGKRRNIRLGTFGALGELRLARSYDVVVCSDMLEYLDAAELTRGLTALVPRIWGVAYLEAYTLDDADDLEGDIRSFTWRSVSYYRKLFRRFHLASLGSHCYAAPHLADRILSLERGAI